MLSYMILFLVHRVSDENCLILHFLSSCLGQEREAETREKPSLFDSSGCQAPALFLQVASRTPEAEQVL